MGEDRTDLHIVLNEDSIDLREEYFDKSPTKNRSPHRSTSQQGLPQTQTQPLGEPLKVNGLRRLANNIYLNQQSNNWQKNKVRSKQRNRATSADPRFRRERSPAYSKDASQTQSDSQVMDSPIPHDKKKCKTQSDSKFIIDRPAEVRKKFVSKPSGPHSVDHSEPANCKRSMDSGSKCNPRIDERTCKSNVDKTSAKYSTISQIFSADTLAQSINDKSTATEEAKDVRSIDCKSLYQTAITDFHVPKQAPEVEVYNATGIYLDRKVPLSPYWDDPRLIEKYSKLLKPIHIRKSKSSWTLPITTTPTCASVAAGTETCPVCSKCIYANIQDEVEQAYEAYEEITESGINYDKIKTKIYKAINSNYYLAAFFMVGSLCGLMLVALVAWVLTNDVVWTYLHKKEEPPRLTGMQWVAAYIGGGLLHGINVLCNKLLQIMVMSRNQVFRS